ncbi:hypothetical protein Agabi119p4_8757 [Agaricus bisporus var. burnettii]|uniref:BPL/LPL catalytic domain-containing protein n=1 Tax=Agaricus bisporus var. burnettii TaxID=192524 RepID=A0A8H7C3R4_AGABI|nr:hypothetical protein Agabi119p4_8757 [Agaricus bisporus var. burnettii]
MNVLVYSGPEVVQASLTAALTSLRTLLGKKYAVQIVDHGALSHQPWAVSCALLVFPQLHHRFHASACLQIEDYVVRGGSFLAFCTAAQGERNGAMNRKATKLSDSNPSLRFTSIKHGDIYLFPQSSPDTKARLEKVDTLDGNIARAIYEVSHANFLDGFDESAIEILGMYIDGDKKGKIAGLGCDVGNGRIALWSPNPEQGLTEELASALSYSLEGVLVERERERVDLLRRTITYLGLRVSADSNAETHPVARPFPQFLVASPSRPDIISRILTNLSESFEHADSLENDIPRVLKDANDTFHFHESTSSNTSSVLADCKTVLTIPSDPSTWQPKRVIIHRDGTLPSKDYTDPYFDIEAYFQHLQSLDLPTTQTESGGGWPIGSVLLFSPAVTSTQTLLDKNPVYLSSLLTPTVSLASHQLIGRGRGSNVWLSPAGSLSTSIHLRLKSSDGVPWNKLVFVQYLYALAICEGVRDDSILGLGGDEGGEGEGWRVRIKWPNDVYALVGSRGAEEKKKIAGILVNTSFSAGGVDIVVGCGLNVFNEMPLTSLSQLLRHTPSGDKRRSNLSLERTAAVILCKFGELWNEFVAAKGSFEPFMDLYLRRWLHSDQLVTLTATQTPTPVRIVGITLDHGLLRTMPERGLSNPYFSSSVGKVEEEYIDLQPDGNSFDLMSGMIKTKR